MIVSLIQYYDVLLVIFIMLLGISYGTYKFMTTPSKNQKEKIRVILLHLVVEAESIYKSGTGKIKYAYVYSSLQKQYVWLKYIPLVVIEELIEETLETMRHLLETNSNIRQIVKGDSND